MNKFSKIIVIISVATNVVFVILFVIFFKVMLYKISHLNNQEYFDEASHSSREKKKNWGSFRFSDDSKKEGRRHARALSREFADYVFSMPELTNNFQRLSQIHHEITEISRDEDYDEERMRELFGEFEGIFIINKNIVVEELLVYMREMDPEDRAYLLSRFLRMPSLPKYRSRHK